MPAPNDGLAGAELAIDDNNTTGRFLNNSFSLGDVKLKPQDDAAAAVNALAGQGVSLVIADLPPINRRRWLMRDARGDAVFQRRRD